MLSLEIDANDDPDFGRAVEDAILGVLHAAAPAEVYVVKVDHWFGPKWLAFSHKILGALGLSSWDLRIPPFVPGRIVHERYFVRAAEGDGYVSAAAPLTLHIRQASIANSARRISTLCPRAALFWWSGSTSSTGRGALMAYTPTATDHAFWYAELTKATGWSSGTMKGITSHVLGSLQATGASTRGTAAPAVRA